MKSIFSDYNIKTIKNRINELIKYSSSSFEKLQ